MGELEILVETVETAEVKSNVQERSPKRGGDFCSSLGFCRSKSQILAKSKLESKPSKVSGKSSGATFVETAFVLPLFLLAIFLFIDFARFFFVYVVLSRAATQGADRASKVLVEVDTSPKGCPPENQVPCQQYLNRVQNEIIESSTMTLARTVASDHNPGAWVALREFESYGEDNYGPSNNPESHNAISTTGIRTFAAFLRPGEKVRRVSDNSFYDHPTRSATLGWPQAEESWGGILTDNPLVVRIEAGVKPFTPFLPILMVRVTSLSYRTVQTFGTSQSGPGARATWGSTATPTVTPTFTATLDWTATPTITPTVTETPTISPTPTITNTPTVTPTSTATPTLTQTPTATFTSTATFTITPGPSPTPSNTATASPTGTATFTATVTPTATETPTITPTRTPTNTATATPTRTAMPTATPTPTATPIPPFDCAEVCTAGNACGDSSLIAACETQCNIRIDCGSGGT